MEKDIKKNEYMCITDTFCVQKKLIQHCIGLAKELHVAFSVTSYGKT